MMLALTSIIDISEVFLICSLSLTKRLVGLISTSVLLHVQGAMEVVRQNCYLRAEAPRLELELAWLQGKYEVVCEDDARSA